MYYLIKFTLVTKEHFGEWRQSDQEMKDRPTIGVMAAIMIRLHPQQRIVNSPSISLLLQYLEIQFNKFSLKGPQNLGIAQIRFNSHSCHKEAKYKTSISFMSQGGYIQDFYGLHLHCSCQYTSAPFLYIVQTWVCLGS